MIFYFFPVSGIKMANLKEEQEKFTTLVFRKPVDFVDLLGFFVVGVMMAVMAISFTLALEVFNFLVVKNG